MNDTPLVNHAINNGWMAEGTSGAEYARVMERMLNLSARQVVQLRVEVERLRVALEIIAGLRPCIDNLMSNADIARAALAGDPANE